MAEEINNITRFPDDVNLSEIVEWARKIGCIVEVRLVKRSAEQPIVNSAH